MLSGVPTNAQLTLTLLRIAEANKSPLPPPPTSQEETVSDGADETASFDPSEYDVESDPEESLLTEATAVDQGLEDEEQTSLKRGPGRRIAAALKRTVKASVGGALSVDHIKAKIGSESAKQRLGAVAAPPPSGTPDDNANQDAKGEEKVACINLPGGEGPCVFSARMHGGKGHAIIVNSATSPSLAFATTKISQSVLSTLIGSSRSEADVDVEIKPEVSIGLADITEMRKMGGFGWKGKLVVGWAMEREVLDGLEITDKQGCKYVITAIKGRDELFNRLIAMGKHKWESW